MRRVILSITLALIIAVVAVGDDLRFPIDKINQTLNYIAIDTGDCSFRTDWVDLDSFRLWNFDSLYSQPLAVPQSLSDIASFSVASLELDSLLLYYLLPLLRNDRVNLGDMGLFRNGLLPLPLYGGGYYPALDSLEDFVIADAAVGRHMALLHGMIRKTADWCDYSILRADGIDSGEVVAVKDSFTLLLMENEKDVDLPMEAIDSLQKSQDALAVRLNFVLSKIDMSHIGNAVEFVANYAWLADSLKSYLLESDSGSPSSLEELATEWNIQGERGIIGGTGNDRYEGKFSIIIDLGGDDEYHLEYDQENPSQIIIDCSGNDRYIAKSDHVFGGGFFGCSILDDWEGNDTYVARHFSLGCGIFGVGILIDREGNDTYRGDICTQGAGAFGIGLLIDNDGKDRYEAALYSQGFGFIMGVGALVDAHDNDIYVAGQKYGDILRYEDHYLSYSQGFGYGQRPYMSGGVGLLVDGEGNDTYIADIFGQGASYWFGLGGLIDYQGNDNYIAYQYAQGAATHLCLAALLDLDGNDLYSSKGVSQGCGHDLAFGLLYDQAGDDQYNATDLSQAAGSANGIGMLIDVAGSDGHMARVDFNTHGYGNPRRDFGSIGLFLDLSGKDYYRGYGKDDSYWVTPSRWGIGADLDSEPDSNEAEASE